MDEKVPLINLKKKMTKRTFVFLAFIACSISIACKDALLGPIFPITDLSAYDCVVIATVDSAIHEDEGYRPLKSFKATIKKTLKGTLLTGAHINGRAKIEEPRAVCPVHLDKNSDYLLLLTKSGDEYSLSRFSFPVKKGYTYFDNYISQIETALK